ncbi:MAG: hypothetical protein HPY45_16080 [Anaerolineae bacterium]|nr:hypothetical protein [Anaerolineae bacterium]
MFDMLTDLKTLIAERENTTDPEQYDELTRQIEQAQKAESIQRAKKQAEVKARLEAERKQKMAELDAVSKRIADLYRSAADIDRQT